jgi:hypothetical protein
MAPTSSSASDVIVVGAGSVGLAALVPGADRRGSRYTSRGRDRPWAAGYEAVAACGANGGL